MIADAVLWLMFILCYVLCVLVAASVAVTMVMGVWG